MSFFTDYLADARTVSSQTGILTSVILAQIADETGNGSSSAFVHGNNFAGVSGGGVVLTYPSKTAGLDAYIETLNQTIYDPVRDTGGSLNQCVALGKSPWAASHYNAKAYNAGAPLSTILANAGIDLVNIVQGNASDAVRRRPVEQSVCRYQRHGHLAGAGGHATPDRPCFELRVGRHFHQWPGPRRQRPERARYRAARPVDIPGIHLHLDPQRPRLHPAPVRDLHPDLDRHSRWTHGSVVPTGRSREGTERPHGDFRGVHRRCAADSQRRGSPSPPAR